jgi:transcriptional regulator with XRE-family HTH domain
MTSNLTVGQKIKYFRQRAGLSQHEFETLLDASPGSVSRIENDQTNPTKETLKRIATELELSDPEKLDLFELVSLFPTEVEIAAAIEESSSYFENPQVLAYLIDEWANVYALSKGLIQMLGLNDEQVQILLRKNLLEIFFDPSLGIRQIFEPSIFEKVMLVELARMNGEANLRGLPGFARMLKLPDFERLFELSATVPESEVLSPLNKKAILILGGQAVHLNFSRESLKNNARFELIEFLLDQ